MLSKAQRCFMSISRVIEQRPRRTIFNVPGHDDKKVTKSHLLLADTIVLDMEDGVPMNRKQEAREKVSKELEDFEKGPRELAVRINCLRSGIVFIKMKRQGFAEDDLKAVLQRPQLDALIIPKVQNAQDIQYIDEMVTMIAENSKLVYLVHMESAASLLNLPSIAVASPRIAALIFGAEDYCADVGITRTSKAEELLFARSYMVNTAKAFNLQAIDMVCLDFKDDKVLERECMTGKILGFTGKQAIHPLQISTVQRLFAPSPQEISKATDIVNLYYQHMARGIGAFEYDGKVVDLPVVRAAKKTLDVAKRAEEIDKMGTFK